MATTDREDAILIKTDGLKLPGKPHNQPMKQRILDAAQRIIDRNPATPEPPTLVSLTITPATVSVPVNTEQQFTAQAAWSDGTTALPELLWTTTGGAIDTNGLWLGTDTAGSYQVACAGGGKTATATITVTSVTTPPDPSEILFEDTFATGALAPEQNGVKWQALSAGTGDQVIVTTGALVHRFKGSTSLTDDAWCESNLKLPDLESVFIGVEWETTAEYFHRSVSPGNNKLLRMFGGPQGSSRDQAYSGRLSVGMSVNPGSTGESWLIGEYKKPEGMGSYGLGPNVKILVSGVNRIRLAQYAAVGSGLNTGTSRIWFNGNLIYDHDDLPLWVDGQYNRFQYAYLPGWSNSGFNVDTDLRLLRIVVSPEPIADFTTP